MPSRQTVADPAAPTRTSATIRRSSSKTRPSLRLVVRSDPNKLRMATGSAMATRKEAGLNSRDGSNPGAMPSKLHLAFAIAVLQTKPEHLSVREFILRLRQHVRPIRKRDEQQPTSQRFEAASYWAQRCQQAELAQAELQTTVAELEMKVGGLRKTGQSAHQIPPIPKRRMDTQSETSSGRPPKKSRLGNDSFPPTTESDDFDTLGAAGSDGAKLMQHLYEAHRFYKNNTPSTSNRSLSYHIIQASNALAPVIASVCRKYQQCILTAQRSTAITDGDQIAPPAPVVARYEHEMISTFSAVARAFNSLLHGFTKLGSDDAKREERGSVIYSFVTSFSQALDTLKETALAQAELEITTKAATASVIEDSSMKGKKKATRSAPCKKPKVQTGLNVSNRLTSYLLSVLSGPSQDNPQHRELIEGFLFVLFQRLGQRMYFCSMGHERGATIDDSINAWVDPESEEAEPTREKQVESMALTFELPNLIRLLERGLAIAPRDLPLPATSAASRTKKSTQSLAAGKPGSRPSVSALKAGLSLAARKKLENTLVNAIYGDDDSDEMMDCFRMPLCTAPMQPPPRVDQATVQEWFIEGMWNLVGWDILKRDAS